MIKFFKLKKIFSCFQNYPYKETFSAIKFLPQALSLFEKIILVILTFGLITIIGFLSIQSWLNKTELIPESGGTFKEGIVGDDSDVHKHITRLINAGLTKYDDNKNIVADMAEKWEISDDGKVYIFHLKANFNSEDLAKKIISQNLWQDIAIATPDPLTITFTFKQSFSPFLYTSTEPIFDSGPYRITKEEKDHLELSARDDYYAGRPWIDNIIIKYYPTQDELWRAFSRGEIQGAISEKDSGESKNYQKFEIKLPRKLILFFNLSNKDLQDINIRKALKENASPGKELNLRLVTSDHQKNIEIAKKIADKWSKNNVKVTVDVKDNLTLQKATIPKRDYDLLLYGLDYGEDPDPYPFWHSSQIKEDGKNLSNFKNTKADKLLEEARQEFDFAKRDQKYAEFQKILDAEIPMFVVEDMSYYYYLTKNVYGVSSVTGFYEADRFQDISTWYINTKRVKK